MIRILLLFLLLFLPVSAAQSQSNSQEKYSDSHWDVYEVTNLNWSHLTDSQKFEFVTEAYKELLRIHPDKAIGVKKDYWKGFWEDVAFLDETMKLSRRDDDKAFSMLNFYFETLKMQGRVKLSE